MAKITKLELFSFSSDAARQSRDTLVTVGNNRQVKTECETLPDGIAEVRRVRCYLHGHNVATFSQHWYAASGGFDVDKSVVFVELDNCGYATTTTRAAMNDFCEAMGARVRVGMARGQMQVGYTAADMRIRELGNSRQLEFYAARRVC